MKVLVVNAGSSSLKYQLFDTATYKVLAKGLCDRIGLEHSTLTHTNLVGETPIKKSVEISENDMAQGAEYGEFYFCVILVNSVAEAVFAVETA